MSEYSKIHQRFSERLKNPGVLEFPQEFLGPNYEAVLNFWMSLDELSEDQWKTIEGRYYNFYDNQRSEWRKATDEANKASGETIGWKFADIAAHSVWDVYYGFSAAYRATYELIGMHKILEQNKPLTFFQIILNQ